MGRSRTMNKRNENVLISNYCFTWRTLFYAWCKAVSSNLDRSDASIIDFSFLNVNNVLNTVRSMKYEDDFKSQVMALNSPITRAAVVQCKQLSLIHI